MLFWLAVLAWFLGFCCVSVAILVKGRRDPIGHSLPSASFPSTTRHMCMPKVSIRRPEGGMPLADPVWVARMKKRSTTMSPSATSASMVTCQSGNAAFSARSMPSVFGEYVSLARQCGGATSPGRLPQAS